MYSKAQIAGRSIHPMLVAFPIAFFVATLAALIAYAAGTHDVFWFRLATVANVAGVILGAVAAVPGFIDWSFGIPKNSPAKATGRNHLMLNLTVLLLFAI